MKGSVESGGIQLAGLKRAPDAPQPQPRAAKASRLELQAEGEAPPAGGDAVEIYVHALATLNPVPQFLPRGMEPARIGPIPKGKAKSAADPAGTE